MINGNERIMIEKNEYFEYSIVMTGFAGMEETMQRVAEHREELEKRFSRQWLTFGVDPGEMTGEYRLSKEEQVKYGTVLTVAAGEGGIFTALWELGLQLGCGLTIDLNKILMKQITIELGELYDESPYYFSSGSCQLYVTKQGYHMAETLLSNNIPAAVIGSLSDTNDRIIRNGDKTQFLTPMVRSIRTGMMK